MKIEIKCRFDGRVLFAHEREGNTIRLTVEAAVAACVTLSRANLSRANLSGANLPWADLSRANLSRANLSRANLSGAYLSGATLDGADLSGVTLYGANLSGAYLSGATLDGADLSGANLSGANLSGANLSGASLDGGEKIGGERPIMQIGPIGSRCAYLVAYLTDAGVRIRAGCYFGSRADFGRRVTEAHGDSVHATEYLAALKLIDAHAQLWGASAPDDAP